MEELLINYLFQHLPREKKKKEANVRSLKQPSVASPFKSYINMSRDEYNYAVTHTVFRQPVSGKLGRPVTNKYL